MTGFSRICSGGNRSNLRIWSLLAGTLLLLWFPAAASAAECTDSWTGPAEGGWTTASNWSAGHVPTEADVACIGSGKTVKVETIQTVGVVQGEGTLFIANSLGVTRPASEAISSIAYLTINGGTLTGSGTLEVAKALSWTNGSLGGTGATILASGATGSAKGASLRTRTLVNQGSLTQSSGYLIIDSGAKLENKGTLTENAEGPETGIFRVNYSTATPLIVNSGTIQKTSGSGSSAIGVNLEDAGLVKATTGTLELDGSTETLQNGSTIEGSVSFRGGGQTVQAKNVDASNATIFSGASTTFRVEEGSTAKVGNFTLSGGFLNGTGTLQVLKAFTFTNGSMGGAGKTVLLPTGSGTISGSSISNGRVFVNEGTMTLPSSYLSMRTGAKLENRGIFNANTEGGENAILLTTLGAEPTIVNSGLFQKTSGTGITEVQPRFENNGVIRSQSGTLKIIRPVNISASEGSGHRCKSADPVECATGNFAETQTDFRIGGRGVGLALSRSYSAQAASILSAFGYGWTSSFSDHLTSEESGAKMKLTQADGATVTFTKSGSSWAPPAWSQDALTGSSEAGYTLTLPSQVKYSFSGAGRLLSVTDRNGNQTTLAYDEAGRLKTITDPAGRQITLTYNAEGLVESAKDPMGHVVKYAYEAKNLTKVTEPGETEPYWQFKYDGSHRMTTMTNGRGGKTTNEYDSSNRVISQVDPAERRTTFEYAPFHTKITNKATGAVTDEWFTSDNEPFSVTHGFGTSAATTQTYTYDSAGHLLSKTDGDGHTTSYGYDEAGDRTSEKDPLGHETKWTYNATHDMISLTTPGGETTTIERDANGNVKSISRPAPGEAIQTTTFVHGEHGQLESLTDPLGHTSTFGYDSYGDRTSETDPLGDKQTSSYDGDSRVVSITSPRGNIEGAEPSQYTTTIERDAQERPLKVTDPLGHATKYAYDANGNLASVTDAKGHTTKYTYNADDERTKVERPTGSTAQTAYDGAGYISSQTDGNGKTTTYVRNVLEQPVEVIDPLGRKTLESFDAAGNLASLTDPAERKTTYSYDAAGRLAGIDYSEEATPDVGFEYDAEGALTAMSDGTGKSSFAYDQLGQVTRSEDGHGDVAEYSYNPAEQPTAIVYPNGKMVSRTYDAAGRLESLTDWLGGTTSFGYDADSNLTGVVFPLESGNEDQYAYDRASRMSEARFKKGAETLAALSYVRDALGGVEKEARSGLPGAEEVSYGYDQNNRLVEAGAASFEYDAADNLTKGNGSTNTYDAASQLETGTGVTFSYDKLGERLKSTPSVGPATTYGYNQAGNLISVSRPEEGEAAAIAETMTYDGAGLLAAKASGLTTRQMTWDMSPTLPLLLSDGERSYVYGPDGLPIEQINSAEEPTYLHHDDLGGTRLLTRAGGETGAAFSYAPYGGIEGETGTASTPLGFTGQYTDAATGLQYLRARLYDPGTGQFLTRDPLQALTRQPYSYAASNPVNLSDPLGLEAAAPAVAGTADGACGLTWEVPGLDVLTCTAAGTATAVTAAESLLGEHDWTDQLKEAIVKAEEEAEAEDDLCLEPRVDPWERGKAIGDARQSLDKAGEISAKFLSTAGGGPPGGSRARALVAVILIVINAARHSG